MIILDTGHATVLRYPEHAHFGSLQQRISGGNGQSFAVTIVSVEEQKRGWLSHRRHGFEDRRHRKDP